jgi:hypothetical protein
LPYNETLFFKNNYNEKVLQDENFEPTKKGYERTLKGIIISRRKDNAPFPTPSSGKGNKLL